MDDEYHRSYDKNKELVREFEYYRENKNHKVVLLRYGFSKQASESALQDFIRLRAECLYEFFEEIKRNEELKTLIQENFRKSKHLVCFLGYSGDIKHVKRHSEVFHIDKIQKKIDINLTISSSKRKFTNTYRVFVFPYDYLAVNKEYANELKDHELKYC